MVQVRILKELALAGLMTVGKQDQTNQSWSVKKRFWCVFPWDVLKFLDDCYATTTFFEGSAKLWFY